MRVGERVVLVSCRGGVSKREISREMVVNGERSFLVSCLSHVVVGVR